MSAQVFEAIKKEIETILSRYPKKEAALLPALHVVQRRLGFIPSEAEKFVAQLLAIKPVRVREVVTFLYNVHKKALRQISSSGLFESQLFLSGRRVAS